MQVRDICSCKSEVLHDQTTRAELGKLCQEGSGLEFPSNSYLGCEGPGLCSSPMVPRVQAEVGAATGHGRGVPCGTQGTGSSRVCGLGSELGHFQSSSIHPAMGDHGQTLLTAVGDMGRGGGPAVRAPHIKVRGLASKRTDAMPGSCRPALPQLLREGESLSFVHADHHKNTNALPRRGSACPGS